MRLVAPLLLLLGITLTPTVWSQATAAPTYEELESQRQRIESVRQQKTQELNAQETACLSKFAVTDCQNKVNLMRRAMLADLKRQDLQVNAVDRQKRAAEQVQRSRERAVQWAARRSKGSDPRDEDTPEQRQKKLDDKVVDHQKQAKTALPIAPPRKLPSGLDAPSVEQNREAFEAKQRALEQRRREREKRLREKGVSSAPLPQASDSTR